MRTEKEWRQVSLTARAPPDEIARCIYAYLQLPRAHQARAHAPPAGSFRRDEEEDEEIERRQFPAALDWPEAAWIMLREIRHSHHPAGQEGSIGSEQTKCDEQAAEKFDHASHAHEREERRCLPWFVTEPAEE